MNIEDFQPVIKDVIRKLRVHDHQKDDLTQDCYLKLWEQREEIERARDPKGFAATLCRNLIIDHFKKNDPRQLMETSYDIPHVWQKASKLAIAADVVDDALMSEALKVLDEKELAVVTKLYRDGYTMREAATVLGYNTMVIFNTSQSAIRKIQKYFGVADGR